MEPRSQLFVWIAFAGALICFFLQQRAQLKLRWWLTEQGLPHTTSFLEKLVAENKPEHRQAIRLYNQVETMIWIRGALTLAVFVLAIKSIFFK